jgi:hypothetical protein
MSTVTKHLTSEDHHAVITTKIPVHRIGRKLKLNIGKYIEEGIVQGRCGESRGMGLLSMASVYSSVSHDSALSAELTQPE